MIGARRGSPLAIGYGDGEMYFGSDAIALAPFTDRVAYLDDGDWAVLTRAGATIHDETGAKVERPIVRTAASSLLVDRGNHRHFMAKEIHEQPEVVGHTLAHYLDLATGRCALPADFDIDFSRLDRLSITACGTASYAGIVAKYWFERFARLPVDIDIASEFRYREQPLTPQRALDRHLAIGRDRRHARLAALRQGRGPEGRRDRQRRRIDHRPRGRLHPADARRAGDRRRLDQGLHLPARRCWRFWRSPPAGRAAILPSATRRSWLPA